MSTFTTILCAVNLVENIDDVGFYARELALSNKAKVILFHSIPRVDNLFDLAKIHGGEEAVLQDEKAKALAFLDKFAQDYLEGVEVRKEMSAKNISDDIIELVEEYCADLVVMGSYATKGVTGFFSQNSSKDVINKTRVPVLVVPNDLTLECTPDFE